MKASREKIDTFYFLSVSNHLQGKSLERLHLVYKGTMSESVSQHTEPAPEDSALKERLEIRTVLLREYVRISNYKASVSDAELELLIQVKEELAWDE